MNRYFQYRRFYTLLAGQIVRYSKTHVIAGGIVMGVFTLQTLLQRELPSAETMVIPTLFLWSTIAISSAFGVIHRKSANDAYLMLPVSSLERLLSVFVLNSMVLPVFIVALFGVCGNLLEGVLALWSGENFVFYPLFSMDLLNAYGGVLVLQAFYALGSAWFKKKHFIRTTFSFFVLGLGVMILVALMIVVMLWLYLKEPFLFHFSSYEYPELSAGIDAWCDRFDFYAVSWRILFSPLLFLFCWFVVWLRITEVQSSDGV